MLKHSLEISHLSAIVQLQRHPIGRDLNDVNFNRILLECVEKISTVGF